MVYLRASDGTKFVIDEEDFEFVSQYKWQTLNSKYGKYIRRRDGKRTVFLHNDLMKPPKRYVTDHINGDRLDNRKSNLRVYKSKKG